MGLVDALSAASDDPNVAIAGRAALVTFFALLLVFPLAGGLAKLLNIYDIVEERRCHVYVLFGDVIGIIDQAGRHFLWWELGWRAILVRPMGQRFQIDLRLDQEYLRSTPVNSEEGAPMGIGIWYEASISDAKAYLFKNTDPRGSLAANVLSSTVRCLSSLPLSRMLEDRHSMSAAVRDEVSPKCGGWGYSLGSIYIRKVHFRDQQMVRQIESKVVNRLRHLTAAIHQDGANQVKIIASSAERDAAGEFGKATAARAGILGEAIAKINRDPEAAAAMFEILESERIVSGDATVTLVNTGQDRPYLADLLTADSKSHAKPLASPQKGMLETPADNSHFDEVYSQLGRVDALRGRPTSTKG